jgi:putative tonB-dependent receptor
MKNFIFFICLLLGGTTLYPQTQYTVKGFVHNASLEGIANVSIKILDADTNVIVNEPVTGSNGLFSFSSAKRNLRIYIESTDDYLSYTGEPFLLIRT